MAIFDALFQFSGKTTSGGQAITGSDVQSEDILDWGEGMEDLEMGGGTPLWLNIKVGTAFAGGTSLNVKLYTHTTATTISSGTLLLQTGVILQAVLTAGAWVRRVPLPVHCDDNRYFGLFYNQEGTFSAGTINAWIDDGSQSSYDIQVSESNI